MITDGATVSNKDRGVGTTSHLSTIVGGSVSVSRYTERH